MDHLSTPSSSFHTRAQEPVPFPQSTANANTTKDSTLQRLGDIRIARQQQQQSRARVSSSTNGSTSTNSTIPHTPSPVQSLRPTPGEQSALADRPHSVRELTRIAVIDAYDRLRDIKWDQRCASAYSAEGKRSFEAGDLEWAFVHFSRTATLVLQMMPTNVHYHEMNEVRRSKLVENGALCVEKLSVLQHTLDTRYETWCQRNPDAKPDLDIPRILCALQLRDNEELEMRARARKERRITTKDQSAGGAEEEAQRLARSTPSPARYPTDHGQHEEYSTLHPNVRQPESASYNDTRRTQSNPSSAGFAIAHDQVEEQSPRSAAGLVPPASPGSDRTITLSLPHQETRELRWIIWTPPTNSNSLSTTASSNEDTPDYHAVFDTTSPLCLDKKIRCYEKHATVSGGYADVWKGFLGEQSVAIKVMRRFGSQGGKIHLEKLYRRLWREFQSWSKLTHANVLRCVGFSHDFSRGEDEVPSLISPWMSNGTVLAYIEKYPDPSKKSKLLIGIAEGLHYLHARHPALVHGDLRANNILVSDSGIPQLCDFGLSKVVSETRGMTTSSETAGSLRWMSPELFSHEGTVTVSSDVWAYGMTALEILTGKRPYHEVKLDVQALKKIIDGETPQRHEVESRVLDDEMWSILQHCWATFTERPSMRIVADRVTAAHDRQKFRSS